MFAAACSSQGLAGRKMQISRIEKRTNGLASSSELLASLYDLPFVILLRDLRFPPAFPLVSGASMSILSL